MKKGRSSVCSRPAVTHKCLKLLSLLGRLLDGRVIRNGLHLRLVDRGRVGFGEIRARRYNPKVSRLGAAAAGAGLDAASIDALLGLAAGEVGLGVDRAFRSQVLALRLRISVAYNHQLGIRLMLQTLSNVIEHGLARVIDSPWLRRIGVIARA